MPLTSTAELVAAARAVGRGIAAFNAITLEHAEAIVAAAEQTRLAAILQVSHNAVRFHGGSAAPLAAACAQLAQRSPVPLALHLDHVEDLALLRGAPDWGFSSAMYDAGNLPHEQNVERTAQAAEWAHGAGLWLEAELGYVGGKPHAPVSAHAAGVRTDPAEATAYVAATRVDALAVAVGSVHAMTTRSAVLDHELIARLRAALDVPLVLHGSSGVPDDELVAAVRAGMTKINVGTALNAAFTGAVRAGLRGTTTTDPRRYLAPAREAMTAVCVALLRTIS